MSVRDTARGCSNFLFFLQKGKTSKKRRFVSKQEIDGRMTNKKNSRPLSGDLGLPMTFSTQPVLGQAGLVFRIGGGQPPAQPVLCTVLKWSGGQ